MKKYCVEVPIAGYAVKFVEANSEKEAIQKALEEGATCEDLVEWDMYEKIVEGNLLHASRNEVECFLEEED